MAKYKKFSKFLDEETTSGDIATVDTKLDMTKRPKHLQKGKKCKKHHKLNCDVCESKLEEKYYE